MRVYHVPRVYLSSLLLTQLTRALTGTFILNSSLLNLKAMSESVLWKKPVGRRTRTSCRLAGKDACKTEAGPGGLATRGPGHVPGLPLPVGFCTDAA